VPPAPDPVRAAIYSRLAGDDDLQALLGEPDGIHEGAAPAGSDPPYVIFSHQAGTEQWVFGDEGNERALWQVKGVGRGSALSTVEAIDARCKELLHRARLALPNGRRLHILRESPVRYGETTNGEQWRHRGGIYRIFT